MNIERDKVLTHAMGECWHDLNDHLSCIKCGYILEDCYNAIENMNPNFSTWEGFGKLWEWSQTQPLWLNISEILGQCDSHCLINPDEFANTIYEMLKDN